MTRFANISEIEEKTVKELIKVARQEYSISVPKSWRKVDLISALRKVAIETPKTSKKGIKRAPKRRFEVGEVNNFGEIKTKVGWKWVGMKYKLGETHDPSMENILKMREENKAFQRAGKS